MITLIVVICHSLVGVPALCHEEFVARAEVSSIQCQMQSQQVVSLWKENSIFAGDHWTIGEIDCKPGDYQPRGAI